MNKPPILAENENKRLNIRLPLLICFAMFAAWQMGMVYFSGQTMSVDGKTPLPVDVDDVTLIIAAGYILSILVMIFVPRVIVWAERITCVAALASALTLFLPLSSDTLALMLYVQYACCCLMIGFETAVIVGLFTEKTAILHLTAAYGIAMLPVAALHNSFIEVPFTYFRLFAVIALALQLLFYCRLPGNVWMSSVTKSDNLVMPKQLFGSIFLWVAMACLVGLFGIAVSETVPHGVFVFYLSSAITAFTVFVLWKIFNISPLSVCPILASMGAVGFVAAIVSLNLSQLGLVACVFLGAASMCCWLSPLVAGILLVKKYPSRFISPAIIGVAFVTVIIHTALLDAFRDNTTLMYAAYLVISVLMVIVYLLIKPYLIYSSRDRSIGKIVEAHNTMVNDGTPAESNIRHKLKQTAIIPLSPRECDVGELTIIGVKRQIIAETLGISPSTVDSHRISLYNKFGVSNRNELLARLDELSRNLPEGGDGK